MFDVGFTEILLIGVVALVVIGPERLPDVARTVGQWIGKTQRFVRGVKRDIANELDSGDLKKLIGDQREQIDELRKVVGSTRREIESSTKDVVRGARRKLTELEDVAARSDAADAKLTELEDAAARLDVTPLVPHASGGDDEEGATDVTKGGATIVDATTGGRTPPRGATPADGANAAARAIGGAIGKGADEAAGGSGERVPDAAPRASSGQIDGQVIAETDGSANETPPGKAAAQAPSAAGTPDDAAARSDAEPAGVRQSGSGS